MNHTKDFLRVVIHNRFKFAQKHFPMIKILIQEVPFQPELKNEIQQLVETELFSHFKKLIVKFQEEGKLLRYHHLPYYVLLYQLY